MSSLKNMESINTIKKIINSDKSSLKNNTAATATPFNTFLDNAINPSKQNSLLNSNILAPDKYTQVQQAANFAQAIAKDELDKKYKKIIKETDDLLAQIIPDQEISKNPSTQIAQAFPNNPDITPFTRATDISEDLVAQAFPDPATTTRRAPLQPRVPLEELTAENVNIATPGTNKLDTTPFQFFMDKAVEALEGVSEIELRVNDLMDKYIEGKVSIEEVSIETAKLTLAISFATTVITQTTQTFKEIQGMQV
ncbi:MAG: hypothetical protein GY730_00605 [bacterium]|nr:hypothetical protein [bacterium]